MALAVLRQLLRPAHSSHELLYNIKSVASQWAIATNAINFQCVGALAVSTQLAGGVFSPCDAVRFSHGGSDSMGPPFGLGPLGGAGSPAGEVTSEGVAR
jgi:hypothetical protein